MKRNFRFLAGVCIIALCCFVVSSCISPERIPQGEEGTTLTTSAVSTPEETTHETTLEETTALDITTSETTMEEISTPESEPDFSNPPDPDGTKRY